MCGVCVLMCMCVCVCVLGCLSVWCVCVRRCVRSRVCINKLGREKNVIAEFIFVCLWVCVCACK